MHGAVADYDCLTCGACCHAPFVGDPWVDVRDGDPTPLELTAVYCSEYDRRYAQRAMRQTPAGRCVALRVIEAAADAGAGTSYVCSVYEQRPATCREFAAGSPACLALRKRLGRDPGPAK